MELILKIIIPGSKLTFELWKDRITDFKNLV
jgi:hypothetical protein